MSPDELVPNSKEGDWESNVVSKEKRGSSVGKGSAGLAILLVLLLDRLANDIGLLGVKPAHSADWLLLWTLAHLVGEPLQSRQVVALR